MSFFDLVLVIIIGGFGLFGLWFGFVHTLGSLLGTVAGAYLASRFYEPVANLIIQYTGWGANVSKSITFIIVFILITRLVGFIFWLIEKALSIVTKLPFIKSIDKISGLVFGLLEGALVVGMALFFISRFPLGTNFMEALAQSHVAPPLVKMASILWPLLPDALRAIKSVVDGII